MERICWVGLFSLQAAMIPPIAAEGAILLLWSQIVFVSPPTSQLLLPASLSLCLCLCLSLSPDVVTKTKEEERKESLGYSIDGI